jgi:uncharacterized membrane protein YfcA
VHRLVVAFAIYAILGVLAYTTLPDERIRLMTFAILGLFAVKTWLHRKEYTEPRGEQDSERG